MTDYYRLIARAVADLRNADEAQRAALYECARRALVSQLSGVTPALTESEIARERLLLEKAFCDIEANRTHRPWAEAVCSIPAPKPRGQPCQVPSSLEQSGPLAARLSAGGARPQPAVPSEPERNETGTHDLESQVESRACKLDRPSLNAEALKVLKLYREDVAEAERLGEAEIPARQLRAGRGHISDGDRSDQRIPSLSIMPHVGAVGPRTEMCRPQPHPMTQRETAETIVPKRRGRSRKTLVVGCLSLSLVVVLAVLMHWQRDRLSAFVRNLATWARHEAVPSQPEIVGSIGQAPQQGSSATDRTPTVGLPEEPAQRAVLYEADPSDVNGRRYLGSVIWRTDPASPGQPLAVRAQVEIPERRIRMTLSLRPNSDTTLPASHTIEIVFKVPSDFLFGGISNVLGMLMKEAEQARGAPLAGLSVKITTGVFLFGLSATDSDLQHNRKLLADRSWFDIPIIYNDGQRAILAIEKGTPGERVFQEAFAAWK